MIVCHTVPLNLKFSSVVVANSARFAFVCSSVVVCTLYPLSVELFNSVCVCVHSTALTVLLYSLYVFALICRLSHLHYDLRYTVLRKI